MSFLVLFHACFTRHLFHNIGKQLVALRLIVGIDNLFAVYHKMRAKVEALIFALLLSSPVYLRLRAYFGHCCVMRNILRVNSRSQKC